MASTRRSTAREPLPEEGLDWAEALRDARERCAALASARPFEDGGASPQAVVDTHERLAALCERALLDGGAGAGRERLAELRRLLAEVRRGHVHARLLAHERVREALRRLAALGPPSELVQGAPAEAAAAAALDRVLLSAVEDGELVGQSAHVRGDPAAAAAALATMRRDRIPLDYPLVEVEALRRRQAVLVEPQGESHGRTAYAEVIGEGEHLIVPVVVEGQVVGFFHGDREASGAPLTALDRETLSLLADGFGSVLERAVLRRRLHAQRDEMRRVARWADARAGQLAGDAIYLEAERADPAEAAGGPAPPPSPSAADLLTRREAEVLERLVHGESNAEIARRLVVSDGTVKYHVKNILRKLQATNRAEAASKYLRMQLRGRGASGPRAG